MKSPQFFIFGSLCFLLFFSTGGALYAGIETGELENKILKPGSEILNGLQKDFVENLEEEHDANLWQNGGSVNIKTETNININSDAAVTNSTQKVTPKTYRNEIHWVYPTYSPKADYKQTQEDIDQWWAQVQEQNQQLSEQSKADLENFQQQNLQKLEQFKLDGEQGMEDFRKQMEEGQKQFLSEHGITP